MKATRTIVSQEGWRRAIDRLAEGSLTLLSLWGDAPDVYMALFDEVTSDVSVISFTCRDGTYPSVGAKHPPAIRLERTIRDLRNLDAVGSHDTRPWIDHSGPPYTFLPAEG
jgi:hypothetical protein